LHERPIALSITRGTPRREFEMIRSTNPDGDCYCSLWDTDPQALIDEGVPKGYCGLCTSELGGIRCGKPGHIRHHPGSVPYTGCWCDEHWAVAVDGFTLGPSLLLVPLGALVLLGWLAYSCVRGASG
jgi:hypothetical protein